MNPSYKLTRKSEKARTEARKVLTPDVIDAKVRQAERNGTGSLFDNWTPEQRKAFNDFENSFPKSTLLSLAKVFVILSDFDDAYRSN